jgi:hypothetical protein
MHKRSRYYEVNTVNGFGIENRVGIYKARNYKAATKKAVKEHDLEGHLRTYPVKLTKIKKNNFF